MLKYYMKCVYCNNEKLYQLRSGQLKCSKCKKKFSLQSVQTNSELTKCFIENMSANKTSKKLNMNYVTVNKRYKKYRLLIANYLEDEYIGKNVIEYDEYIYLSKSKKKIRENIFDSQNFLTFNYENKIYNLLMPSITRYKNEFIDNGADEAYFKEFSKFMMYNKISKTQKMENLITRFWIFFEESILKYKGISDNNFFLYLKEIEFKFNYSKDVQNNILNSLYFKVNR